MVANQTEGGFPNVGKLGPPADCPAAEDRPRWADALQSDDMGDAIGEHGRRDTNPANLAATPDFTDLSRSLAAGSISRRAGRSCQPKIAPTLGVRPD
jgi:hypothetical protein